jgi:hypothetical protein
MSLRKLYKLFLLVTGGKKIVHGVTCMVRS